MTSKFSIDNRELLQRISSGEAVVGIDFGNLIIRELAAFRLAAMDSESGCLPLDYLQGHKDGLEWAARLAEANHPDTGDWLYDDPIELAKAIRKGPDMPPAPVVPEEKPIPNTLSMYAVDAVAAIAEVKGWNACRAAMLQAGNSPVIPEGYVMVPKEPTAEMQSAGASAIRIETTALNKLWTGNAVFRAMLAASPQEDINALIPLVSRNEREVK
ncbi:Uncharacterised protein [Klebsiella pneumoniae]|uniref:hypothetical protein n=1 Tax=Klebsiella pneumoniae TaxID=573 RepID=UPI000807F6A0|nr:hypothetical protein [Klebsiella pneumoniae]SBW75161.1 Uncharacterised protein [Klebsiella pneumoniae]